MTKAAFSREVASFLRIAGQRHSYIRDAGPFLDGYADLRMIFAFKSAEIFMITFVPSRDEHPSLEFLVGHHEKGGWFVFETHGLAGGLFRSELEALRYLAADFRTRAKRIDVVEETLDPFVGTCVQNLQRPHEAMEVDVLEQSSESRREIS